jgi:hypothetical protein
MKARSVFVIGIVILFAKMAFAQDDHKLEVTADYSYVHANPQNNNIIPTFSLNGGGGSAAFYFSKYIGIEAEFEAMLVIRTTLPSPTQRTVLAVLAPYRFKAICSLTT